MLYLSTVKRKGGRHGLIRGRRYLPQLKVQTQCSHSHSIYHRPQQCIWSPASEVNTTKCKIHMVISLQITLPYHVFKPSFKLNGLISSILSTVLQHLFFFFCSVTEHVFCSSTVHPTVCQSLTPVTFEAADKFQPILRQGRKFSSTMFL